MQPEDDRIVARKVTKLLQESKTKTALILKTLAAPRRLASGKPRRFRRFGKYDGWSRSGACGRFPAPGGPPQARRTPPRRRSRCTPCDGGCDACAGAHSAQFRRER